VTHYPSKFRALTGDSFDWSADTLPTMANESAARVKTRTYAHAVAEVIFGFLGLIWLLLVPRHPFLVFGPGVFYLRDLPFHLAPVWVGVYWWVVALNVVQLSWRCIDLSRGSWREPRRAQHLVVKIFGLIPLALLLTVRDQAYFTLQHPEVNQPRYGATVALTNHSTHLSLMVVCAIVVLQLVWDLGRIGLEAYRKRAAAK
jgi:hypothetical protein